MACFAVIVTANFKVYQTLRKKEAATYLLLNCNVPEIINTKKMCFDL